MTNNKYLVHSLIFLFCFISIPQTSKSQDSITVPSATLQTSVATNEEQHPNDGGNNSKQKQQATASSTRATTGPISNTSNTMKAENKKKTANNITAEALQTILKSENQILVAKIDSSENYITEFFKAELESLKRINEKKINESASSWKVLCITGFLISFIFSIYIIRMLNKLNSTKNASANILSLIESIQDGILKIEQMLCGQGEPPTTPQPTPTPEAIIAYEDAIQAFVHINNYIEDLRQHNALIMPLITCLAQGDAQQDLLSLIDLKKQSEQERIRINSLISKIKQFLTNNKPAIDHYLSLTSDLSYKDCIRCPIGDIFSKEQDENILGDRMLDEQKIKSVFKLGFHFPDSKGYPYREKSLII